MTKQEHNKLTIGTIIRKNNTSNGVWIVIKDHEPRGHTSEREFIVTLDVLDETVDAAGWCGFTLSNTRGDLHEYKVITRELNPEYYL